MLKQNQDKIDWDCLSMNVCDGAIELLKQNPDKINYEYLSFTPLNI